MHITLEIVHRGHAKGFEVLPRRWVERTSASILKHRRLVRDYKQLTAVAEILITIAASATLLRRWAGQTPSSNALLAGKLLAASSLPICSVRYR